MNQLFVDLPTLLRILALSETALLREISEGQFPKPREVGQHVGWLIRDVEAWAESRPTSDFMSLNVCVFHAAAQEPAKPILTEDELVEITRYRQPKRQADVLDGWKVPYERRIDGSVVVGRAAFDQAMGGENSSKREVGQGPRWTRPDNGFNWSR